jgi:hypothetical protein
MYSVALTTGAAGPMPKPMPGPTDLRRSRRARASVSNPPFGLIPQARRRNATCR